MERAAAEQIVAMLMRATSEVTATIDVLTAHGPSEEQVKRFSNAVGQVVLAIDDVLRPILNEYPDLHP